MSPTRTAQPKASQKTKAQHLLRKWLWTGDGVGVAVYVRENKGIMVGVKAKPMGQKESVLSFVHLDRIDLVGLIEACQQAMAASE